MPLVNLRGSSDRLTAYPPLCFLWSLARFSITAMAACSYLSQLQPPLLRVAIPKAIDTGPSFRIITFLTNLSFRTSV